MATVSEIKIELDELIAEGSALLATFTGAADAEKQVKFVGGYQEWYSRALPTVRLLAPEREHEFASLYRDTDPRRGRELIEVFGIHDYLSGRSLTQHDSRATISGRYQTQLFILSSLKARLESALANLRGVLQADLFDSELDAADHLRGAGHLRAAGAVAGVVLEAHLDELCTRHSASLARKNHTISNLNDALKNAGVIDVPTWRRIQALGDIRNLCDHKGQCEPTDQDITDLIEATRRYTKELQ